MYSKEIFKIINLHKPIVPHSTNFLSLLHIWLHKRLSTASLSVCNDWSLDSLNEKRRHRTTWCTWAIRKRRHWRSSTRKEVIIRPTPRLGCLLPMDIWVLRCPLRNARQHLGKTIHRDEPTGASTHLGGMPGSGDGMHEVGSVFGGWPQREELNSTDDGDEEKWKVLRWQKQTDFAKAARSDFAKTFE